MKSVKIVAILALLAVAVSSPPRLAAQDVEAAGASEAAGAPKAVVAEAVIDAGNHPVSEVVEARFEIENQGDAPLEISQVHPACGCTVVDFDKTIAPGETGHVLAKVDTTSELGPIAKSVTVFTNDPDNARIELIVKADVRPFLNMEPGLARYTSFVHQDRDQSIGQLLWTDDFPALEITEIEKPWDWVDVTYRKATEGELADHGVGNQWRIDVTLGKEAPVGPLADHVLVHTNHPKQKVIEIPITGFVRPMVAVTPQDVNFGKVDPVEAQRWGILVRNFGSAPMSIESVDSTIEGIDVVVEALQDGQQYKLTFTPTAEMPKGPFEGHVEVVTNLPQQPKITVNLSGEVI